MTGKSTWTPEEDQKLRDSLDREMSITATAILLDRPRSTVSMRMRQLWLKSKRRTRPEWTEEEDNTLRRLWVSTDIPKANLSVELKRNHHDVLDRADFLKLPKRKPKHITTLQFKWPITPWPEDMPHFEDHPNAPPPGSLANAIKAANRYVGAG